MPSCRIGRNWLQLAKSPFNQNELILDERPSAELTNEIIKKVGAASSESNSVSIPFHRIQNKIQWTGSSVNDLSAAWVLQELVNKKSFLDMAQHNIAIAGKTGSGKSNTIHIIILNIIKYPPSELELYLIDFKKGVEFKIYATHKIPHQSYCH